MRWGWLVLVVACGARSPLEVDERLVSDDAAADARLADGGVDAGGVDAGVDAFIPPSDCEMCRDADNATGTPDESCVHGLRWLAWEWRPTCDMELTGIELHVASEGEVAILSDGGGRPGRLRATGTLGPLEPDGWRHADLVDRVLIEGERTYWIAESTLDCSLMSSGSSQQTYFGANALEGEDWSGPHVNYYWAVRMTGTCR